jgi:hypothetical protein
VVSSDAGAEALLLAASSAETAMAQVAITAITPAI